jgi:hypothetical protein
MIGYAVSALLVALAMVQGDVTKQCNFEGSVNMGGQEMSYPSEVKTCAGVTDWCMRVNASISGGGQDIRTMLAACETDASLIQALQGFKQGGLFTSCTDQGNKCSVKEATVGDITMKISVCCCDGNKCNDASLKPSDKDDESEEQEGVRKCDFSGKTVSNGQEMSFGMSTATCSGADDWCITVDADATGEGNSMKSEISGCETDSRISGMVQSFKQQGLFTSCEDQGDGCITKNASQGGMTTNLKICCCNGNKCNKESEEED